MVRQICPSPVTFRWGVLIRSNVRRAKHAQVLAGHHIRHNRTGCRRAGRGSAVGMGLVIREAQEYLMMSDMLNPMYWDKKIKIAILALATFAAMC